MTTPRDDDALTWEGDEPGGVTDRGPALPQGFDAVGKGADAVGRVHDDGTVTMPGDRRPTSNAMLITLGVIGGVYLLYAIGWIVAGLRLIPASSALVTPVGGSTPPLWESGAVGALVLAVAAPAVWFAAGLVLTRARPVWVRIAALVAGVVLLVPWPFVSVGVIGS